MSRAAAFTLALLLASFLAASFLTAPAVARADGLSARFQEFLTSELYQLLITSKWDQQARIVCGGEAGRSGLEPGQLVEVAAVEGEDGVPTSGAWIHRVPGRACGHKRVFNILVEFGSDGPKAMNLLPGNTLASPALQLDVLPRARALCLAKFPECELPIVVDTAQAGRLEGVPGGWIEVWFFDVCRAPLAVTVYFAPDGEGGTVFEVR